MLEKKQTNIILSAILLAAIVFSIVRIGIATAPDPGHNYTEASGGVVLGDIIYGSGTDTLSKLAGAAGFLKSTGAAAPAWSAVNLAASADVGSSVLGVGNGGTGGAPGATDQVIVSDSTSAATWRTIPDCSGNGKALRFTAATNTFDCNTLQFYNSSVAIQSGGFLTDTYVVNSNISIPTVGMQAGTRYHAMFQVAKTGSGTATPIVYIRFGPNASTGDPILLTLTFGAQTNATTDVGTFEIWVTFRSVGSGTSAVVQGTGQIRHSLATTGLSAITSDTKIGTSAGFDSTAANAKIGISANGGTSSTWTVNMVQAELTNLN